MKRILSFLCFIVFTILSFAQTQNIMGAWKGELDVQGNKLPIVFHIKYSGDTLLVAMDSPKQGAKGIPTDFVSFENQKLKIKVNKLYLGYEGILKNDSLIEGVFKQGMMAIPLNLVRGEIQLLRPQEPKLPYPYNSEDVYFENRTEGFKLAGTFTCPKGKEKYPAVVLITGSGQQDRNEEIMGHKPFLVLSDYLARKGIAVMRFDDRGFGESEGDVVSATSRNFASDVRAAIDYLKSRREVDISNIGLVGHSEGGSIAFMLASEYSDIAYIVSMAGPGLRGDLVLDEQQKMIIKAQGHGLDYYEHNKKFLSVIADYTKGKTITEIEAGLDEFIGINLKGIVPASSRNMLLGEIKRYASPWMQFFLKYDPIEDIKKIKCPVLAINGSKDLQVKASANLSVIKENAPHAEVKEYENLNHLFQNCRTGLIGEYGLIEETISEEVLKDIADWILNIVDK